jgi:hypothetical protein
VEHAKGKSKSKSKPTDKGKEKELSAPYEYEDGSVHDNALHADIIKGYERFKVSEVSFCTSVEINSTIYSLPSVDTWLLHFDSCKSRTASPRTTTGTVLYRLGLVLELGRWP